MRSAKTTTVEPQWNSFSVQKISENCIQKKTEQQKKVIEISKQPAFQFYPADWLRKGNLNMASFKTKGIWIDLLCYMWFETPKGKISGTEKEFCRLLGIKKNEFLKFLSEIRTLHIASIMEKNDKIFIKNRRMFNDEKGREKARQGARERKKRERSRKCHSKDAQKKQQCHASVTPCLHLQSSNTNTVSNVSKKDREGFACLWKTQKAKAWVAREVKERLGKQSPGKKELQAYLNCALTICYFAKKRWRYDGDCKEEDFETCSKFFSCCLDDLRDALERKMVKTWPPAYLHGIVEKSINEEGEGWFKGAR